MIYEMPNGTQVDAHQVFYIRPWGKETNSGTLQQPLLTPRPIFGLPSPRFEPHADKPVIVDLGEDTYDFDRMLSGGFFANNSGQKYELWFMGKMEKTEVAIKYFMPYQTNPNGRIKMFHCIITEVGSYNYTPIQFNNCGMKISTYLSYNSVITFNNCTFGSPYGFDESSVGKDMFIGNWTEKTINRCYGILSPARHLSDREKRMIEHIIATNNYKQLFPKLSADWYNADNQPFGVWYGEYAWRYPKDIFVSTNCLKTPENLEVVVKNFDGTTWITINDKPINGVKQNENWRGTILANQLKSGINVLKAKNQQMQIFVESETLSHIQLYPSQCYSTTHTLPTLKQTGIRQILTDLIRQQATPLTYAIKGTQHNSVITAELKPHTIKIESR